MKKLKLFNIFTLIPILGAATLPLVSCGQKEVTITFQPGDGGSFEQEVAPFKVKKGTKWSEITNRPTPKADSTHLFDDWYIGTTKITDDQVINNDVTVIAKFAVKCTITFEASSGGSFEETPSPIYVKAKTKWCDVANKPKTVPDQGYEFDDWYIGSEKLTANTEIEQDCTVTAKFKEKEVPIVEKCEHADVYFYRYDTGTSSYVKANDTNFETVYNFNDSSIGYLSVDDFLSSWGFNVSTDTTNHKTTFYYDEVTSPTDDDKCIIDYKNQTITFNDYERFTGSYTSTYGTPMTTGCNGGKNYFNSVTIKKYEKGNALVLDLSKYNITAYEYQNKDGDACGFLPYELFKNVFDLRVYPTKTRTGLVSDQWDYNGNGFYEIIEGLNQAVVDVKAKAKAAARANFYNADYMEYTYNLLALTLDMKFGLPYRNRRNKEEKFEYLKNGAYEALKPYHDDLVSMDADKSSDALRKFFKENLDDGGHTAYINQNVFSTAARTGTDYAGEELLWKSVVKKGLTDARNNAGITASGKIKNGYQEYTNTTTGDKIAYITFDSFVSQSGLTAEEKAAGEVTGKPRELPQYTTDSNYMKDTMRLTMYANEKLKADKQSGDHKIKDIVVDLSCNGGGVAYTALFIASWLCGGVTHKIYNPHTSSYCEYEVKADIDGDGDFDEDDKLASDIQLYVITSCSSFSCGNLLPTSVQDYRPNTVFIGTKSGGGACYVESNVLLGLNTLTQFSSSNHILRGASSYGNFITNDDGETITDGWAISDVDNPSDFYDRDAINTKIWNK